MEKLKEYLKYKWSRLSVDADNLEEKAKHSLVDGDIEESLDLLVQAKELRLKEDVLREVMSFVDQINE
jgi:hypothetical protein